MNRYSHMDKGTDQAERRHSLAKEQGHKTETVLTIVVQRRTTDSLVLLKHKVEGGSGGK